MKETHFSFSKEEPNAMVRRNPRKSGRRTPAAATAASDPSKTGESPKKHRSEARNIVLHNLGRAGEAGEPEILMVQDSGRERLKRHRTEVAGRVSIPERWGQEELLKDWVDFASFDALLVPNGIAMAREALVAEGRRG